MNGKKPTRTALYALIATLRQLFVAGTKVLHCRTICEKVGVGREEQFLTNVSQETCHVHDRVAAADEPSVCATRRSDNC